MIKHIGIAGNIGAGKTTLTMLLAKHYGWQIHLEEVDNNPYLNDFYNDMHRWSFNLQIYFLHSRFKQLLEIRSQNQTVIQDRTIYEDAYIFAPNLHAMGLMSTRDFENYRRLFDSVNTMIHPPDILIYLRASVPTLIKNISKRGRAYEDSIRIDYLKRLNERYEAWINAYDAGNLLIIDIDNMDFASNKEDLGIIVQRIEGQIHGLF